MIRVIQIAFPTLLFSLSTFSAASDNSNEAKHDESNNIEKIIVCSHSYFIIHIIIVSIDHLFFG